MQAGGQAGRRAGGQAGRRAGGLAGWLSLRASLQVFPTNENVTTKQR